MTMTVSILAMAVSINTLRYLQQRLLRHCSLKSHETEQQRYICGAQRKHGAEGHDGGVRLTTNHGLLRSHCHMEEHSRIPPPNVYCAKHCECGERN